MSEQTLTYKYRLYPSRQQERGLLLLMERMRWLYNACLQQRQEAWARITIEHSDARGRRKGLGLSRFDQSKQLTELRGADPEWAALNCAMSREPLHRADLAFQAFFRRCKVGLTPGYPRFKGKGRYNTLAFEPTGSYRISPGERIAVPNVDGLLRVEWHRPMQGTPKQAKVTHEAGQWFLCVVCAAVPVAPLPPTGETIGVDVGVSAFAALDDGTIIANPRHLDRAHRGLVKAQRRLARCKKGSNRRKRAVLALQKRHAKVARCRKDFHHKTALGLLQRADVVKVEALQIKNLTKSAKGTEETPGKNVRQKAGLNRRILDAGWGSFVTTLESKAAKLGRQVVKVNPRGTSQACSGCGQVVKKTLAERTHRCPACGLVIDRDVNAARNIKAGAGKEVK